MRSRKGIFSSAAFLFVCLSFGSATTRAAENEAHAFAGSKTPLASAAVFAGPSRTCVDACYTYGEGATCACDLSFCSGCDWCQGDAGPGPDWPFGEAPQTEADAANNQ